MEKKNPELRNVMIGKSESDKEVNLNDKSDEFNSELKTNILDKAYDMVIRFFGEVKKRSSKNIWNNFMEMKLLWRIKSRYKWKGKYRVQCENLQ